MFLGYDRHDGSAGIRNHVIILSTVVCANGVAQMVERMVPGTVAITHNVGCDRLGDGPSHTKVLANLGCNGNVFAAIVIGLGCEEIDSCRVANLIAATGRPVAHFVVQQCGGSIPTAEKAARAAREFLAAAEHMERMPMEDSRLIVGLECGGSDAMSGITANPVMGLVSDRIAAAGGTVILTEIDEMVGTEEVLRRQLVSEELGCQLTELIRDTYQRRSGFFHVYNGRGLSVGTLDGGVTTIQEQSLGCIKKGGSTPILQLLDYGQVPDEHGLVIMDGPGQDTDSMAGLVASGAQMILFSTGRGTPAGVPIASVVKIASNSRIYGAQRCDFDFNANGSEGDGSLGDPELLASRLHGLVLETACGRETAAERNLQNGFMTIWCKNFTV